MLRVDIKNFFPSITEKEFYRQARIHTLSMRCWKDRKENPEDWKGLSKKSSFASKLFARFDGVTRLPQGAPTSPYLADMAMRVTDFIIARGLLRLAHWCEIPSSEICYTRYVDDLVVSVGDSVDPSKLKKFLVKAKSWISSVIQRRWGGALTISEDKTKIWLKESGHPLIILGYSVGGGSLQVPKEKRDEARRIAWKILNQSPLTPKEKGLLSYVMSAHFRLPAKVEELLPGIDTADAACLRKLKEKQEGMKGLQKRNRSISVVQILADSFAGWVLHRGWRRTRVERVGSRVAVIEMLTRWRLTEKEAFGLACVCANRRRFLGWNADMWAMTLGMHSFENAAAFAKQAQYLGILSSHMLQAFSGGDR